jgi:hypothetical protein
MSKMTDAETVSKVDGLIGFCEQERFTYSRQWYINKAFYENNHFVMWNRFTRTIDRVAPIQGTVLRCIPKTRKQIEAVNNMILANEIRWMVIPDEGGQ